MCAILVGVPAAAQIATHAAEIQRILVNPAFKAATGTLDKEHGRIVEDGIKLTEIPAPPFGEYLRAEAYAQMFKKSVSPTSKLTRLAMFLACARTARATENLWWCQPIFTPCPRL